MQENYLAKWLSGELSEEELAAFKQSAEHQSFERLKEVSSTMKAPKFDMDQALERTKETIGSAPKVITLKPYKAFLRIAAVVAILLVGSYFYLGTLGETVSTDFAENTNVILPDDSEIILNAASQITYSKKNWDKERNINLEGEAFFKVAKGKKFTVATDQGTVAVLGTQFNVENREGFFEVTCYEGLVSVTHNNKETKLPAGNSFLVINGKIISDLDKPTGNTPSWMQNESSFNSIPLQFVYAELERQFNIKVTTENVDTNLLFTGSFNNTNLEMALKSISTPSQIRFKVEDDNVLFYAGNTSK
ncbi:FecR family protein [Flagellimonas zhangzhouensis]|uniref:FecR family protein n=1 Tax=Flagellimonas zhangzhouensis TaxID=1073328 RepID=A0A1H2Q899_9FLAO|nr:FecR family protein [Allomuricauda zhangzhouensis]SDQ50004.1 FecR family protein [Allomuricauda zhangzhouensis]SDW03416.1 FecR family protein [Allomuricauda zhangzhouensis]